jgi:Uri superfamily endonuclease
LAGQSLTPFHFVNKKIVETLGGNSRLNVSTTILTGLSEQDEIPSAPGSYALCFSIAHPTSLAVGRLGRSGDAHAGSKNFEFPAGYYIYLGSAFGPGGLRARLNHHLRPHPKPHWHLDFLQPVMSVQSILWNLEPTPLECCWSQMLAKHPGASIPVPGFGASDCHNGCRSHLICINI